MTSIQSIKDRRPKSPSDLESDKKSQSVQVEPGVWRRSVTKDLLLDRWEEEATTLYHSFQCGLAKNPQGNCLGYRVKAADGALTNEYKYETYEQIGARVSNLASGLRNLGLNRGDKVAFYSRNRPEWTIAAEACNAMSLVSVAIYDTLGPESAQYIVNHSESVIAVAEEKSVDKLIGIKPQCERLTTIVCMDPIKEAQQQKADASGVRLVAFTEVERLGSENKVDPVVPSPDDLAVLMYTSGTTGTPKGVMITHRNLIAAVAGVLFNIFPLSKDDVFFSFLPLAHVFARACESAFLLHGGTIGYSSGDTTKILEEVQLVKPTIFAAVPRVYDRIYDGIKKKLSVASAVKKWVFNWGYNYKKSYREKGQDTPRTDKMVFAPLRAALGGRCRGMISGSAPLRSEVQEFLGVCFGCPFVIGYGLTETCCGGTIGLYHDTSCGHIGTVDPCVEIKLDDVPELNYFSKDNKGEICIRGPAVTLGYYKDEEKTREVYELDGWFHTGDIGQVNPDGTISIIDRKKNIFKLSQGEYVAIEKVEASLATPLLMQFCAYGDSFQSYLVALGVPDFVHLKKHCEANGIPYPEDNAAACKDPKIIKVILDSMTAVAKGHKLHSFEIPKKLALLTEPFSVDNGLLTPSFKVVRAAVAKQYKSEIDALYAAGLGGSSSDK